MNYEYILFTLTRQLNRETKNIPIESTISVKRSRTTETTVKRY